MVMGRTTPDIPALTDLWYFLLKVPPRNFQWSTWFTGPDENSYSEMELLTQIYNGAECGTTACVAGWAAFRFPDRLHFLEHSLAGVAMESGASLNRDVDAFAEAFGLSHEMSRFICVPVSPTNIMSATGKYRTRLEHLEWGSMRMALLNLSAVIEHYGGGDLYAELS